MKLPSWLPLIGAAVGGMVLTSAVFGLFNQAGYVVTRAQAQTIAEQAVMPEEVARLEYVLTEKRAQLRKLQRIETPTAEDVQEIADLQDDIKRIRDRLEDLK